MGGFNQLGVALNSEQKALLHGSSFTLRPLASAGHLDLWKAFGLSWLPVLVLVFSTAILTSVDFRYSHEQLLVGLYCLGLAVLLIYPALALGVLVFGVVATQLHSRVRWSAVVFWTWWPFWRLALCVLAAALGSGLGNHLWYHQFLPHTQLTRLQAYTAIDPSKAKGVRLQDAGIVDFGPGSEVDRTRIGCLKNGATYCVAPIFSKKASSAGEPPHDLFMVGKDCCGCPGEFRCGDWDQPGTLGGVRVVDSYDRDFYRLAAEDWAATHKKKVNHPVFFKWNVDPQGQYRLFLSQGQRLATLGVLCGAGALVFAALVLNFLLALLVDAGWVKRVEIPVATGGIGQQITNFHPHMTQGDGLAEPAAGTEPTHVVL